MSQQPSVKRFIAGAVCPRCGEMDRLRCWRDDVREHRECVHCDYTDSMRLDGAPEAAELPTRVNQQTSESAPGVVQIPVVEVFDAQADKNKVSNH